MDARLISISPINAETGAPAYATQAAVAGLKSGQRTNGVVVAVTTSSAHIFKPASSKGAQKTFDNFLCDSATVARFQDRGYAIIGLFGDGRARAYSIPGLKEVGNAKIDHKLDIRRFGDAILTGTGDIFGWAGPSEMALLNVWGAGLELSYNLGDRLYNPQAVIPPRPTISNLQWISGTQYITPADMDLLIGGPNRPPSRRMLAEMREAEHQNRLGATQGRSSPSRGRQGAGAAGGEDESYYAWMQRQVQERTERLGLVGESIDLKSVAIEDWSVCLSKFVSIL